MQPFKLYRSKNFTNVNIHVPTTTINTYNISIVHKDSRVYIVWIHDHDEHPYGFQCGTILNSCYEHSQTRFYEHMYLFILGKYLRVELLDHLLVSVCLTLWQTAECFSKWLYHFRFLLWIHKSSSCSISFPTLDIVSLFHYCHQIVILICRSISFSF